MTSKSEMYLRPSCVLCLSANLYVSLCAFSVSLALFAPAHTSASNWSEACSRQQEPSSGIPRQSRVLPNLRASSMAAQAQLFGLNFIGHSYPIFEASLTRVDQTHWVRTACAAGRAVAPQ